MVEAVVSVVAVPLQDENTKITEIKSVNHRYFEFSSRTPRAYGFLDEKLKGYIQSKVSRGKIECYVYIEALEAEDCTVEICTFDSPEGKKAFRHTASHIMAQAVKRLFPEAKLAIGPAVDDGFYYDFDSEKMFTPEMLEKIEEEMKKIIKADYPIEKFTLSKEEALKLMEEKGEPYKVELINDLPEGEVISFYKQGAFIDLCRGPHLPSTGKIKAFKLISCTGAYWKGDANNKMLQRIYGTAFPKTNELEEHLARIEEAKKRDHNKLGRELGYFTTVDTLGQGLPVLLEKGSKTIQVLQRFVEDYEQKKKQILGL